MVCLGGNINGSSFYLPSTSLATGIFAQCWQKSMAGPLRMHLVWPPSSHRCSTTPPLPGPLPMRPYSIHGLAVASWTGTPGPIQQEEASWFETTEVDVYLCANYTPPIIDIVCIQPLFWSQSFSCLTTWSVKKFTFEHNLSLLKITHDIVHKIIAQTGTQIYRMHQKVWWKMIKNDSRTVFKCF